MTCRASPVEKRRGSDEGGTEDGDARVVRGAGGRLVRFGSGVKASVDLVATRGVTVGVAVAVGVAGSRLEAAADELAPRPALCAEHPLTARVVRRTAISVRRDVPGTHPRVSCDR
jgi:hypothetical protein